jgi:hypothetical protein
LHLPITPCFYLGDTQNLQPANPCIDSVSWQTYNIVALLVFIGLTWGFYRLSKNLWKHKKK